EAPPRTAAVLRLGEVDSQAARPARPGEEPLLPVALEERRRYPGAAGEDRRGVEAAEGAGRGRRRGRGGRGAAGGRGGGRGRRGRRSDTACGFAGRGGRDRGRGRGSGDRGRGAAASTAAGENSACSRGEDPNAAGR